MYKIYKCWYNDGDWHSGPLPTFYYIAESEEEVRQNSKRYAEFVGSKEKRGGDIWISETDALPYDFEFENRGGFEITVSVRKV